MRKTKVVGLAFVALVLMAAITVGSASAAEPATLKLDQGASHTALAPGEFFQAFQEEFNGSKFVEIKTEDGTIECRNESNHNAFSGEVLSNELATDAISLTGGGFEFGEPCKVAGGGSASVEPTKFPWTLSIHRAGQVKVKGSPKVMFVVDFESGAVCTFQKSAVQGFAPRARFGVETPLTLDFVDQTFKLLKSGSTGTCPSTAQLSMELETGSTEGQVFETLARS